MCLYYKSAGKFRGRSGKIINYLDFHTHQNKIKRDGTAKNIRAIYSLDLLEPISIGPLEYFSVGLHPWQVTNKITDNFLIQLEDIAKNPHCLFIGETGIDTLSEEIIKQTEWFQKHIILAKKLNKPLVIHSVKSFDLILSTLKKESFSDILFFHDFNGNADQIKRILKVQKNAYFSLGKTLLAKNSKISKNIKEIPKEKIFLESDGGPIPIQVIYQKASWLLNIDQEEMTQLIWTNFKNLKLTDDTF